MSTSASIKAVSRSYWSASTGTPYKPPDEGPGQAPKPSPGGRGSQNHTNHNATVGHATKGRIRLELQIDVELPSDPQPTYHLTVGEITGTLPRCHVRPGRARHLARAGCGCRRPVSDDADSIRPQLWHGSASHSAGGHARPPSRSSLSTHTGNRLRLHFVPKSPATWGSHIWCRSGMRSITENCMRERHPHPLRVSGSRRQAWRLGACSMVFGSTDTRKKLRGRSIRKPLSGAVGGSPRAGSRWHSVTISRTQRLFVRHSRLLQVFALAVQRPNIGCGG